MVRTKNRNPIDPLTGKPKMGRPPRDPKLGAQRPAKPPPRSRPLQPPPTTTTSTPGSSRDADLRAALAEVDRDDPKKPPVEGAQPLEPDGEVGPIPLTEAELVDLTEMGSGLLVFLYALFTGRELPNESKMALGGATRKMLALTSKSTLIATGEFVNEHADDLRLLGPAMFGLTALGDLLRKCKSMPPPAPKPEAPRPTEFHAVPNAPGAPVNHAEPVNRVRLEPPKSNG